MGSHRLDPPAWNTDKRTIPRIPVFSNRLNIRKAVPSLGLWRILVTVFFLVS